MTMKDNVIARATIDHNPRLVRINHEVVNATRVPAGNLKGMSSGLPSIFWSSPQQAIAYFLALNSINYMFWSLGSRDGRKHLFRYEYDGKVGAVGMRAAFDKLWGDTIHPTAFREQPITPEFIVEHFGGIPDPESRAALLSDIFKGDKLEIIAGLLYQRFLENKAVSTGDTAYICEAFPLAYRDPYFKRAQLAVFWMAGFFAERGIELDTREVTAFADYQVPRVLRALGVLEYAEDLGRKVDSLTPLDADSPEERAIRGATILACEELAEANNATAGAIDSFLWSNRNLAGATPFHLTFTEHY